jgi:hypothetical protein
MKWKRFLLIGFAAAVLALTLYAVSLARAGTRTMQTTETDRAEQNLQLSKILRSKRIRSEPRSGDIT